MEHGIEKGLKKFDLCFNRLSLALIFQETYLSNNMTRKNISENSIILVDGIFNLTFYNFYPYQTNIMVAAPSPLILRGGGGDLSKKLNLGGC